jgi:outer membrane murein-binding lipoprotein Lpp
METCAVNEIQQIDPISVQAEQIASQVAEASANAIQMIEATRAIDDPAARAEYIEAARAWIEHAYSLTEQSRDIIRAAGGVVQEAVEQRDHAVEELNELVEALKSLDCDAHPLVSEMYEAVEYDVAMYYNEYVLPDIVEEETHLARADGFNDGFETGREAMEQELANNISNNIVIPYGDAITMLRALTTGQVAESELKRLINMLVEMLP